MDRNPKVVQVAVGMAHGLLLTDEGQIYSWAGKNEHGELGRNPPNPDAERKPAPVGDAAFKREVCIQIACGWKHCLALTQDGKLYAWGHNKAGQLGQNGLEAFDVNAGPQALIEKIPRLVWKFNGKDGSPIVKSISCGPESSACVTMDGDVYVWGSTSYYLFGQGKTYTKDENCTVPVKLRSLPKMGGGVRYIPYQITIERDRLVCTVANMDVEDDLQATRDSLKTRSNLLSAITRATDGPMTSQKEEVELEDITRQIDEFREQRDKANADLSKIDDELENVQRELARIGRELTVCDQNDTANSLKAEHLETKKDGRSTGEARRVDTELNDIGHFKSSNKKTKMNYLETRDSLEGRQLKLVDDRTFALEVSGNTDVRMRLLKALQKNELGSGDDSKIDDGLKIAVSKHLELAATSPPHLADKGTFTGFREVLSVSDKALQDVSSALKEVSATVGGIDGAFLEEALEYNLKIRKDFNQMIRDKLIQAEGGPDDGMQLYHKEAQMPVKRGGPAGSARGSVRASKRGAS